MSIVCPACLYDENPDDAEFCEACGHALPLSPSPRELPVKKEQTSLGDNSQEDFDLNNSEKEQVEEISTPVTEKTTETTHQTSTSDTVSTAKLIALEANAPVPEFVIRRNSVTIGKFDPDTGPVDVNLEKFIDSDNISRKHAEIYQEQGQWKIKDLGSTNGVFIRRSIDNNFGARITFPETLNSGDEIAIAQTFLLFQTD